MCNAFQWNCFNLVYTCNIALLLFLKCDVTKFRTPPLSHNVTLRRPPIPIKVWRNLWMDPNVFTTTEKRNVKVYFQFQIASFSVAIWLHLYMTFLMLYFKNWRKRQLWILEINMTVTTRHKTCNHPKQDNTQNFIPLPIDSSTCLSILIISVHHHYFYSGGKPLACSASGRNMVPPSFLRLSRVSPSYGFVVE